MGLQVYYFSTLIYFHTISRRAAKALGETWWMHSLA